MAEGSTTGRENRLRTAVITYFPMFIATLSLVTSIYNGYLNGRFVDLIERNSGAANTPAHARNSSRPTSKPS